MVNPQTNFFFHIFSFMSIGVILITYCYNLVFFYIFGFWKSELRLLFQQCVAKVEHCIISEPIHLQWLYKEIGYHPLNSTPEILIQYAILCKTYLKSKFSLQNYVILLLVLVGFILFFIHHRRTILIGV